MSQAYNRSKGLPRNRIINGCKRVDQRNNGAVCTSSNLVATYGVDRFVMGVSQAGKLTSQRSTLALSRDAPSGYSEKYTVAVAMATLASSDYFYRYHNIEGYNVADLLWGSSFAKPVVYSFYVYSSVAGNFSGCVRNNGSNRSYVFTYTINQPNTLEFKSILIPGDTIGVWYIDNALGVNVGLAFGAGIGCQFSTATINQWQSGNFIHAAGTVDFIKTAGATFYITGESFVQDTSAGQFPFEKISDVLKDCQRYYQTVSAPRRYINASTATGAYESIPFLTPMRVAPTVVTTSAWIYWNAGNDTPVTPTYESFPNFCLVKSTGVTNYNGLSAGAASCNAEL